jgi:hypothetical protein
MPKTWDRGACTKTLSQTWDRGGPIKTFDLLVQEVIGTSNHFNHRPDTSEPLRLFASTRQSDRALCTILSSIFLLFCIRNTDVPHSPYHPDLAPDRFWLFEEMNTDITCRSFGEPGELPQGIQQFMQAISAEERKAAFHTWHGHVRWVIAPDALHYKE